MNTFTTSNGMKSSRLNGRILTHYWQIQFLTNWETSMFGVFSWKNLSWAIVCLVTASPIIGYAESDEDRVIGILEKTRHLTFRGHSMNLSIDYLYPESLFEMAQNLSENDIPTLLKILEKDNDYQDKFSPKNHKRVNRNFKLAQGASYGLASLCGKSINPILAEVKANRLDSKIALKNDPLHWIDAFSGIPRGCSAQDAQRAKAAQQEIEQFNRTQQAQDRLDNEQRQANADRINMNGIKMLDPKSAKTLTLEERKEVFENSVKAFRFDKRSLTVDEKVLLQKMYDTMVLQKGGHSSN
jgi:hypothetical protein